MNGVILGGGKHKAVGLHDYNINYILSNLNNSLIQHLNINTANKILSDHFLPPSYLIIAIIYCIKASNSYLVILPSPFTSSAFERLSMSEKEGYSTWNAYANLFMSCPN